MFKKLLILIAGIWLLGASLNAQTSFISEDFETMDWGVVPEGWKLGGGEYDDFSYGQSDGIDGSKAIYAQILNNEVAFLPPAFSFGVRPKVEFYYKTGTYAGNVPANCLRIAVSVSFDEGETWQEADSLPASEFEASEEYTLLSFDLSAYANRSGLIKISARRAPEISSTILFYVDNFSAGTQLSNDLSLGSLQGKTFLNLNEEATYTVNVANNGSQAQDAYSVRLCRKDGSVLCSVEGTALAGGEKKDFELKYIPTVAGIDTLYAEVVIENDELPGNNRTDYLPVKVLAEGFSVQLGKPGNGLTVFNPFGFEYSDYVSQTLYTAEEMNYSLGYINTLLYEGKFAKDLKTQVTIWIGEATVQNLFRQSVSPEFLTKVFEGEVNFPAGDRQIIAIPLQQSYQYKGGNLVVYIHAHNDEPQGVASDAGAFYQEDVSLGAVMLWSVFNDTPLDPSDPAGMDDLRSHSTPRPNLTLLMDKEASEKTYTLTFDVRDEKGDAITDAVVRLNDSTYPAGQYVMDKLPAGGYSWSVSGRNYSSRSGKVGIIDEDVKVDVTLHNLSSIPYISDYFVEDFNTVAQGSRPAGWTGNFYVEEGNGIDDSRHLTHSFWFMDGSRFITTHPVFMGGEPVFELSYRVMDRQTYPQNAFKGTNMSYVLKVSTDLGTSWETLYEEDYGTHVASKDYKTLSVDVSGYADQVCMFELEVTRDYNSGSDEFYFDIDNWRIGTQSEQDLCIAAPIAGARIVSSGKETKYQVVVRNTGTTDYASYSVKLMLDGNEIGSAAGGALKTGTTAVHEISHTLGETGNFVLTASVEANGDMVSINNVSNNFYLSVVEENISASAFEFFEGNDFGYAVPFNFHVPYSLGWTHYPKEEMSVAKDDAICGIAYKTKFSEPLKGKKVTIWVCETDSTFISARYLPSVSEMQKVFEGTLDFSDADGDNLVIPFSTPYVYQGKNLVVCAYKESQTAEPWDSDRYFYGRYRLGTIRAFSISSQEEINPQRPDMTMGSTSGNYPSTVFLSRSDMETYNVRFEVTDKAGHALEDAVLTFDGRAFPVGQYVVSGVVDGRYEYRLQRDDAVKEGTVEVNGQDVTEKVVFEDVDNEINAERNMIKVYPNPTAGRFCVETSGLCREIGIYDIYGKQVCRYTSVEAGQFYIDLTAQHSGIYLLLIDGKAFKITKR